MPNDTITPQIEIAVRVRLGVEAEGRVLRRINALHGHPDGVPLDQKATPEHAAATHTALASHEVRLRVVAIDADGRLTFEVAP